MQTSNRVAIITGSATGVGAAAARQLAAIGCRVVVNYTRSEREAEDTVAACRANGGDAFAVKANVADEDACQDMVAQTLEAWGRVDYLVNNAARTKFASYRDLDALSGQDFLDIYQVNVVGTYQMTRAVAPIMRRQGRGAIVNTSSIGAFTGIASSIAYAASKAALNMMTQSLALALGPEIRVNAIAPGPIQTRWLKGGLGEEGYQSLLEHAASAAPLKCVPTADQIAESIVWFLTGASVVSGTTLLVDAGIHCGQLPEVR
jgi:3-oxoacyl-[acyl-carrier protein] reductase